MVNIQLDSDQIAGLGDSSMPGIRVFWSDPVFEMRLNPDPVFEMRIGSGSGF